MSKKILAPFSSPAAAALAGGLLFAAAAPAFAQANRPGRLDMVRIANEVQRRGFADYIPVAYRTMGFDSDRIGPADNHARAHFLLYMARDCSHFVLKWEIPAPVIIPQEMGAPKEIQPEYYTHNVGPPGTPKGRLVTIENKARNAVLRSYQVGRMKRIWTRGPMNTLADAAHARGEAAGGLDKWGALITCGLYLGSSTPVAAYQTPSSEYGDDLSGGAVLEIPANQQRVLQAAVRMKSIQPQAAPLSWKVTANVFNAYFLRQIAHLKSVEMQIDFWGGAAMDVVGVFMIVADPPSGAAEGALTVLSAGLPLVLPDDVPNVLDPFDILWFITKSCLFKIIDEQIGNLGEISMARLGFMTEPERFQVAPWTFVVLSGPPSGTDTWNAVELRGGYRDVGEYRWVTAAGACTDWAARVSVRPSLIVQPGIETPSPFICEIHPNYLYIQMKRDNTNWGEVDKFLLEHIAGGVNAPIFWVSAGVKVNYEMSDQEVLRMQGSESVATASAPSVTRRQFFHGSSAASGAVPLDIGSGRRFDFDRPHPEAVMVHGMEIPVDVTFVRGILPQGGFLLQKGSLQAVQGEPVYSIGNNGKVMVAVDYDEKWWYVTAQGYKNRWEAQAAARKRRRADSLEYNRNRLRLALDDWAERFQYRYDTNAGNLTIAAEPSFRASGNPGTMILRYIPEYQNLTLKQPIVWESLLIDKPTRDYPDVEAIDPCLKVEDGRYVLTWTNPRTKKKMTMIVKAPAARTAAKSPDQR